MVQQVCHTGQPIQSPYAGSHRAIEQGRGAHTRGHRGRRAGAMQAMPRHRRCKGSQGWTMARLIPETMPPYGEGVPDAVPDDGWDDDPDNEEEDTPDEF